MKLICKISISLMVGIICSRAYSSNIYLHKKLPLKQKMIIVNDLKVLKYLKYGHTKKTDPILKVLNLSKLTDRNMVNWLEQRVQVVLTETPYSEMTIKVESDNYSFPYKDILPDFEILTTSENILEKLSATTVMSNIGSAVYFRGKETKKLPKMVIDDRSYVISSPRVGIIMIGKGHFFEKFNIVKGDINAYANSLNRLSTFFHEARHSDGHGKSLSFFHAICPKGHDYENLNACDRNLNGPYSVGALVTKKFIQNCNGCKIEEKEALKMRFLSSLNRVIKETSIEQKDESGALDKLKKYISTLRNGFKIEYFKGDDILKAKKLLIQFLTDLKNEKQRLGLKDIIIPSTFWDPSPEGRR